MRYMTEKYFFFRLSPYKIVYKEDLNMFLWSFLKVNIMIKTKITK